MGKSKKKQKPTSPKAGGAASSKAGKKKQAEALEIARRVEEVLRIRLDGAQFHDVVEYATEKKWGINERQIRTYMQRADELLVERQDTSRKKVIARHLAQRMALYARTVNAADYRTALAILADEAKLRGLYPEAGVKELLKLVAAYEERIRILEAENNDSSGGSTPPADQATAEAPRSP